MKSLHLLLTAALLFPAFPAVSQNINDAILSLTGASCTEELEGSEIERFEAFEEHPLKLNVSSRSKLMSSGLLTKFQVASLIDYRKRCGPVMSYAELALVDGFGNGSAEALKPFTELGAAAMPGAPGARGFSGNLLVKGSAKHKEADAHPVTYAGGWKLHAEAGERLELNSCSRTTYSEQELTPGTMNMTIWGKGGNGKLILGDYAARFGQGLVCWSGFSLSGYSTVAAFRRNGSGLSTTRSFTEMNRGVAADCSIGAWTFSAAASLPLDKGSVANINYCGRTWNAGVTSTPEASSVDFMKGFRNLSTFGEAAWHYSGGFSALAGAVWSPSYGNRYALLGRFNCKGESGMAAGLQRKLIQLTCDSSVKPAKRTVQCRSICTVTKEWQPFGVNVKPALRLSHRWKDSAGTVSRRSDIRADLDLEKSGFCAHCRMNFVHCIESSWLCYAEGGYRSDGDRLQWHCHLRWTLFKIDRWDDRIYCYERDAPGNFNVPAYYGRGWAASAVGGIRSRHHALYARLSSCAYPWTVPEKPSTTECRIQYQFRF